LRQLFPKGPRLVSHIKPKNSIAKVLKETLSYIKPDVHSNNKLAQIQKVLNVYIDDRKKEVQKQNDINMQRR